VVAGQLRFVSPHMKYINLYKRGYGVLDITRERVQCDIYHVATIDTADDNEAFAAGFVSEAGNNVLHAASSPAATRSAADPAPEWDE
jgi:alkaline phosphatase D